MRPAKVPGEVGVRMVWESLCERMDPETPVGRPSWRMMMRKIHVCRQRIADAINLLKAEGKIEIIDEKIRKHNRAWNVRFYKLTGTSL